MNTNPIPNKKYVLCKKSTVRGVTAQGLRNEMHIINFKTSYHMYISIEHILKVK